MLIPLQLNLLQAPIRMNVFKKKTLDIIYDGKWVSRSRNGLERRRGGVQAAAVADFDDSNELSSQATMVRNQLEKEFQQQSAQKTSPRLQCPNPKRLPDPSGACSAESYFRMMEVAGVDHATKGSLHTHTHQNKLKWSHNSLICIRFLDLSHSPSSAPALHNLKNKSLDDKISSILRCSAFSRARSIFASAAIRACSSASMAKRLSFSAFVKAFRSIASVASSRAFQSRMASTLAFSARRLSSGAFLGQTTTTKGQSHILSAVSHRGKETKDRGTCIGDRHMSQHDGCMTLEGTCAGDKSSGLVGSECPETRDR